MKIILLQIGKTDRDYLAEGINDFRGRITRMVPFEIETIPELKIDDRLKVRLIEKCGETEFRLVEGSDEYIQLEALLASFAIAGHKERAGK